jgi:chromosome segregation ATPase
MRRIQSTPKDPDVEESRAELVVLEGHKNAAHAETAEIVKNRRRVEARAKEQEGLLQAQIQAKKEELANIEKEHHNRMYSTAIELEKAIAKRDVMNGEVGVSQKKLVAIQKDIAEHDSKKKPLDASIVSLMSTEERLRKSIAHLAPEVRILETKKAKVTADIPVLEQRIAHLYTVHADTSVTHAEEVRLHSILSEAIPRKKEDVAKLNTIHAELERKIIEARSEVVILEERKATLNKEMSDREAKANEAMANTTNLEVRVGEKLEYLRNIEKEIKVEDLARFGYKKM